MVTFRGGAAVSRSLDALTLARAEVDGGTELAAVIVDNASRDGTAQRAHDHASWAELVELPRNTGFAAACNTGIRQVRDRDLIVLLNPDVEVPPDFLTRLGTLDWPADVAARGPAIIDPNGVVEQSARGFPRARTGVLGRTSLLARVWPESRLLRDDLRADPDSGSRKVDWVSGACLIVPAEMFRLVGLLDEGYFMYWEDADWCHRAHALRYSVIYDPALSVIHHQGSSSRDRWAATTIAFHRSALRYWRVNVAKSRASTAAVAVALSIRCMLKLSSLATQRAIRTLLARRTEP
jgi:GT2 family glycosyltransferase